MEVNVYDFDKTIYNGDSTLDFYRFALKKKPKLIMYLPLQLFGFFMYMIGSYEKKIFKEKFFSFVRGIDDIDKLVCEFWKSNSHKIKSWYLKQQSPDDLVISASPEFLLKGFCASIGINNLIATKVSPKTGEFLTENCYGEEKVARLQKEFREHKINKFYSDSRSDSPLALLAQYSYLVDGDNILDWNDENHKAQSLTEQFLSKTFFMFVIIGGLNVINGIIFSYAYSFVIGDNIGFILGYLTSLVISYLLNSKYNYKEKLTLSKFVKFVISYIPNFICQNIIVVIFMNYLGWNKLLVYAIAAIIGVPLTYLFINNLAFSKSEV